MWGSHCGEAVGESKPVGEASAITVGKYVSLPVLFEYYYCKV